MVRAVGDTCAHCLSLLQFAQIQRCSARLQSHEVCYKYTHLLQGGKNEDILNKQQTHNQFQNSSTVQGFESITLQHFFFLTLPIYGFIKLHLQKLISTTDQMCSPQDQITHLTPTLHPLLLLFFPLKPATFLFFPFTGFFSPVPLVKKENYEFEPKDAQQMSWKVQLNCRPLGFPQNGCLCVCLFCIFCRCVFQSLLSGVLFFYSLFNRVKEKPTGNHSFCLKTTLLCFPISEKQRSG